MRAILIALGNPMRRDDGVAQAALEMLDAPPDVQARSVTQLAPEVANDIAPYDTVVFVDADASAKEIRIESVKETPNAPALSHVSRPADIVALARQLFRFAGRAFVCRIPATDFSAGEGLSRRAKRSARRAAAALEVLLRKMQAATAAAPPKTFTAGS